ADVEACCRLHVLPLVLHRRGQVELVRRTITQALAQGESKALEMIAAQRAWLAWRDGDVDAADHYGQLALEAWRKLQQAYPFQWMGVWPLLGVARARDHITQALEYVHLLLAPTQQRLPEVLRTTLEAATEARPPETAWPLLHQALLLAQEQGFL